jgi:hypothetical protein
VFIPDDMFLKRRIEIMAEAVAVFGSIAERVAW